MSTVANTLRSDSNESWDPGGLGGGPEHVKNNKIYALLFATSAADSMDTDGSGESRTELDSHANMEHPGISQAVCHQSCQRIAKGTAWQLLPTLGGLLPIMWQKLW